jgi:hypothetical protein
VGIVRRGLKINAITNTLCCCSVMLYRYTQAVFSITVPVMVAAVSVVALDFRPSRNFSLAVVYFPEACLSTGPRGFLPLCCYL